MHIRPETESEFDAIHELVEVAFRTAYVSDSTEQDFVRRLRAGEGYIPELALVMVDDEKGQGGRLVGHIMLTRTTIAGDSGSCEALLLAPVCVIEELRGHGLGSELIREALHRARELGFGAVLLVGDPAYYQRFGFGPAAGFAIRHQRAEVDEKYVMALELTPGALRDCAGEVDFV